MNKARKLILGSAAGLVFLLAMAAVYLHFTSQAQVHVPPPDYWPTEDWQTSTPEQQGLDSEQLAVGLQNIQQKNIPIHSLMIVRKGYVLLNAAFYPYDNRTPHNLGSVTKSVLTTLIGIALEQGKLSIRR